MCGRVVRTTPVEALAAAYACPCPDFSLPPNYNVAPGQALPTVLADPLRSLVSARWGLRPVRTAYGRPGPLVFNARSETAAEKPSFRQAMRSRRGLVLVDGFYEWQGSGKQARPWFFRLHQAGPFPVAGVWETVPEENGGSGLAVAILTTSANALLAEVHPRMPVILAPELWARWLDPAAEMGEVLALLRPYPDEGMVGHEVGLAVNDPTCKGAECLDPPEQASLSFPVRR